MGEFHIDGESLRPEDVLAIAHGQHTASLSESSREAMVGSRSAIEQVLDSDDVVYGINTGFGPMAQYKIKDKDHIQLQYNLIRSHASGTGKIISPMYVRASILARLNSFMLGYSGVHRSVIKLMIKLINNNITPIIYEHGGVGASGDLVQLAHLALVLIGEGEVLYKGERQLTQKVFEIENIKPIPIKIREGIALMNGTSVMSGIGIINTIYVRKLLNRVILCSSAINELVRANIEHLSFELNHTKKHIGQQKAALRRNCPFFSWRARFWLIPSKAMKKSMCLHRRSEMTQVIEIFQSPRCQNGLEFLSALQQS